MFKTRSMLRLAVPAVASVAVLTTFTAPAEATIHPLIQSVNCAAAAAFANADIGDPGGQTPAGFAGENISVAFPFLTITFSEPLAFDQSDFRALQATGFIDQVVTNSDGLVTALIVDLTSLPNAGSGQGGLHCANAG